MANRGVEPRMENLVIEDIEQLRAMANPYHRKIFRFLDEQGCCTSEEMARAFCADCNEVEEYLHGLVSIGLLDFVEVEGETLVVQAAKYYSIGSSMFSQGEGVESIRELLVDRVADLAQGMVNLNEDYINRGRITFNQLNLKEEDVQWVRERLSEVMREVMKRSTKTAQGDTHSFRLALFFYPEGTEQWLKKE